MFCNPIKNSYKQTIIVICVLFAFILCNNSVAETRTEKKLFREALINIDKGQWANAEIKLIELLRTRPYDPVILNNLSWVYFQSNQPKKGKETLLISMHTNSVYRVIYDNIKNMRNHETTFAYNKVLGNKNIENALNLRLLRKLSSDELNNININGVQYADAKFNKQITKILADNKRKKDLRELAKLKKEQAKQRAIEDAEKAKKYAARMVAKNRIDAKNKNSSSQVKLKNIRKNLRLWAKSWSAGDSSKYLKFYAKDFSPSKGISLQQWRNQRKTRVDPSKNITINYRNVSIEFINKSKTKATTIFTQTYRSLTFSSVNKKQLFWSMNNQGLWRISLEKSL